MWRNGASPGRRAGWIGAAAVLLLFLPLVNGQSESGLRIAIWIDSEQRREEIELEEYVKGVVAAEMPALFHIEALKAQAVAARTFAVHRLQTGAVADAASGAVLRTDPAAGQGWTTREAFRERYGLLEGFRRWFRVSNAVAATEGLILTYNGAPIQAVYHSTSGGRTESAENYWGAALPYLRGVPDPFGDDSPHYVRDVYISLQEFIAALGVPPDEPARPIEVAERTEAERVRFLRVGERLYTGRQVREALGLPSAWFDVEVEGGRLRFAVRGYGHGVGLPQYGADGMARAGYTFDQILRYYYTGVEISRIGGS